MRLILIFIFAVTPFFSSLFAQKMEQEKNIKEEDFPQLALKYLKDHFEGSRKIKFYQEISTDSLTYEAKFKWNKFRYSVEFFPDGRLMDIEKRIPFSSIPVEVTNNIKEKWEEDFKKYKISKCQEQSSNAGTRYEIELKGKNEDDRALYEYLFDSNGAFIQKREIILRTTDMTLY